MKKLTIEDIRERGWIAYEYKRGSHAYHLNTPTSDEDFGGVFICPKDDLMGLRSEYVEQVADEKNDRVYYELGRWVELLLKSNPTALESLFIPKDCVIGDVHPAVQLTSLISATLSRIRVVNLLRSSLRKTVLTKSTAVS